MEAVVDRMPWAILSILFGRDVDIMIKLHGDVRMNALLRARTYIPWQSSYSAGIVMVLLSNVLHYTTPHTCNTCSFAY